MPDCPIDARPVTDAVICPGCTETLRTELRTIPDLVDDLVITLTRQSRVGDRNGPRPTERPLVYDHRASVDLETLRDGLAHWCREVAQQRQITVDADHDAKALARWLLRWAGAAAQHTDAAELHDDICAMTRAARRTIDLAPELRYVGPCDNCQEDLYVGMHAATVTCRTEDCDAEYDIAERRIWLLEQAVDRLYTAAELSRLLPWIANVTITSKLIGMWATRGRLTRYLPHPRDTRHATRFRVGEVIDLARAAVIEQHGGAASGAA